MAHEKGRVMGLRVLPDQRHKYLHLRIVHMLHIAAMRTRNGNLLIHFATYFNVISKTEASQRNAFVTQHLLPVAYSRIFHPARFAFTNRYSSTRYSGSSIITLMLWIQNRQGESRSRTKIIQKNNPIKRATKRLKFQRVCISATQLISYYPNKSLSYKLDELKKSHKIQFRIPCCVKLRS